MTEENGKKKRGPKPKFKTEKEEEEFWKMIDNMLLKSQKAAQEYAIRETEIIREQTKKDMEIYTSEIKNMIDKNNENTISVINKIFESVSTLQKGLQKTIEINREEVIGKCEEVMKLVSTLQMKDDDSPIISNESPNTTDYEEIVEKFIKEKIEIKEGRGNNIKTSKFNDELVKYTKKPVNAQRIKKIMRDKGYEMGVINGNPRYKNIIFKQE